MALSSIYAQDQVGIGTTTPNNAAILDLESTSQGFLAPRLTSAQRDNIALTAPATGLMIYNLTNQSFEVNISTTTTTNWATLITTSELPNYGWGLEGNSSTSSWNGTLGNYIGTNDNSDFSIVTTQNRSIYFWTNNTQRLQITNDGRIGVGIFPPTAGRIFDANGNGRFNGDVNAISLTFEPQGADPSNVEGKVYYNSNDQELKYYNGTVWQPLGGSGSDNLGNHTATESIKLNGNLITIDNSNIIPNVNLVKSGGIGRIGFSSSNSSVTPVASAFLQLNASEGGFLMPRIGTGGRDNFDFTSDPAPGLMIYNIADERLQVNLSSTTTPRWNNLMSSIYKNVIDLPEVSAPPAGADTGRVYVKTDGNLYFKNEAGTEFNLTSAGSSLWTEASGEIYRLSNVGIGNNNPANRLHVTDNIASQAPTARLTQLGAGDASLLFDINGGQNYTIGADNDDDDNFKISNSSQLNGTSYSESTSIMVIHNETDSKGIVDFPNQSRARFYLGSAQNISNATWETVNFASWNFDQRSEFNSGTHKFTAKQEGYYQVNARVEFDLTGFSGFQNSFCSIKIVVGGSTDWAYGNKLNLSANIVPQTPLNNNNAVVVSDVVYLSAGQTIEIQVYQNTSSAKALILGSPFTYCSIHKLS